MSGYAIVQWNWGNGLSVSTVPEKWIISVNGKLKCYFPKSRNAAKAVKEQHDVRADWQLFDVRKLSSKSIKNYDTALSKEDKARFTSELDSNSDSETSLNITKCDKTRNRRRPNYLDAYTDGIEETALVNVKSKDKDKECKHYDLPDAPLFGMKRLSDTAKPLADITNTPLSGHSTPRSVRNARLDPLSNVHGSSAATRLVPMLTPPDHRSAEAGLDSTLNRDVFSNNSTGTQLMPISTPQEHRNAGAGLDSTFSRVVCSSNSTAIQLMPISTPPEHRSAEAGLDSTFNRNVFSNNSTGTQLMPISTPPEHRSAEAGLDSTFNRNVFSNNSTGTQLMPISTPPEHRNAGAGLDSTFSRVVCSSNSTAIQLMPISTPPEHRSAEAGLDSTFNRDVFSNNSVATQLMPISTPQEHRSAGAGLDSTFNRNVCSSNSTATPLMPMSTPPEHRSTGTGFGSAFIKDVLTGLSAATQVMPISIPPEHRCTGAELDSIYIQSNVFPISSPPEYGDAEARLDHLCNRHVFSSSYSPTQLMPTSSQPVRHSAGALPDFPINRGILDNHMTATPYLPISTHSDLQRAGGGLDSGFTRELFDHHSIAAPFEPIPSPQEHHNVTLRVSDVQSTNMRENSSVVSSLTSAAIPPSSLSGKIDYMIAIVRDIQARQIQFQHELVQLSAARSSNMPVDEMELEDFGMPIDNDESMTQLSTMLKEKRDRINLKKVMARHMTREISKGVLKLMKACITNKMAAMYSLLGKNKDKRNFSTLPLYKVIIQVVIQRYRTNQDAVNGYISSFLRHAPGPKKKKLSVSTSYPEVRLDDNSQSEPDLP